MSIASEIARINKAKTDIRNQLNVFGLVPTTANIDDCATAVKGIENKGAVQVNVQEGDTYTIPKGYHNGSGTVSGVAGGGNYSRQEKSVTPTKSQQNVTPDSGYYALSAVTVAPIPEAYQDVTPVTAVAADVLANKIIVDKTGKSIPGTMPNNGAVSKTLDTATTSYTVPLGYHDGKGTVKINTETKSVTPTKSAQSITPTSGKVLSKVDVAAIPAAYQDVTSVTAIDDAVLEGYKFVNKSGEVVVGTIPTIDLGDDVVLSTSKTSFTITPGYWTPESEYAVYINLEEKTETPTKSAKTVTPSAGKVLSKVTVAPIPDAYQDVTPVTINDEVILEGYVAVDKEGEEVHGSMPNNGSTTKTIDGLTAMSATIPAGYTTGGTVTLTGDIEAALKDI